MTEGLPKFQILMRSRSRSAIAQWILRVKLDGSNSSRSAQTLAMLQTAWTPNIRSAANLQVDYLYGYDGR